MGKVDYAIVGQRFHRLFVKHRFQDHKGKWLCFCECDCGNTTNLTTDSLRSGKTKSCGCWKSIVTSLKNKKHGAVGTLEYNRYRAMKGRCLVKRYPRFKDYGGRGITICDSWLGEGGFANFLSDMGPISGPGYSIERLDNDGNYEPGNCRWATGFEQCRNKRNNRNIPYNGIVMCISDWSKYLGIDRRTLEYRIRVAHWDIERAFTTPVGAYFCNTGGTCNVL